MKTIQVEKTLQDDIEHAIDWLKLNYPKGVDLVYTDYRDCLEDGNTIEEIFKNGYQEDESWIWESQDYSIADIIENYQKEFEIDMIDDEVVEEMRMWLQENDTSTPMEDLLNNTGSKLFYIETVDEVYASSGTCEEDYQKQKKEMIQKYAKTEEEKKEIEYIFSETFYDAPVSFYFYADVSDIYNAIHKEKGEYITVDGAYFSSVDRVQGSNWIGNKGIFKISMKRQDFIDNFYADNAEGNGYGWGSIAGQTGYDEAGVYTEDVASGLIIETDTSEAQKREKNLAENYAKTGKCTFGDMNYSRHKNTVYENNYPCGSRCKDCGTFWID